MFMSSEINQDREERIEREVLVDTYNGEEQRLGWYYYLEDNLKFPFKAMWKNEEIEIVSMSEEDDCLEDMYVEVKYQEEDLEDTFSISLSEIDPIDSDSKTLEAIGDWKYWLDRGYSFEEDLEDEYY